MTEEEIELKKQEKEAKIQQLLELNEQLDKYEQQKAEREEKVALFKEREAVYELIISLSKQLQGKLQTNNSMTESVQRSLLELFDLGEIQKNLKSAEYSMNLNYQSDSYNSYELFETIFGRTSNLNLYVTNPVCSSSVNQSSVMYKMMANAKHSIEVLDEKIEYAIRKKEIETNQVKSQTHYVEKLSKMIGEVSRKIETLESEIKVLKAELGE